MLRLLWADKATIQHTLYAICFLVAQLRGAAPERILASMLAGMLVVDALHHAALGGGSLLWHQANLGHMAIDWAMLAGTVAVALRANRIYPLWIGGAQIIATMAHFYRLGLEEINRFAYDMMVIMPSYIQLLALMLGLGFHMSRERRLGSYPSWRSSSGPARAIAAKPSRFG